MKKNNEILSSRRRDFLKKSSLTGLGLLVLGSGKNGWGINSSKMDEVDKRLYANSYAADKKSSLWKYISELPVIDTHEHISSETELLGARIDIFNLFFPYIIDNLESAGMTTDEMQLMKDGQVAFEHRWTVFNKYYPEIQYSSYVLALQSALAEHYQFKNFTLDECVRISGLLIKDFAAIGFMQKFMDKNKIEAMLTYRSCSLAEVNRSYGKNKISVVPTVSEICVRDSKSLENIANAMDVTIRNLDDLLAGIDKLFHEYAVLGIRNIKIGSAYNRVINYKYRTREEAELSFAKIMTTPYENPNAQTFKSYVKRLLDYHLPLDDYLTVYMMSLAEKYNMNVIFHLGLAAWNFNSVENSHSSSLEWLIKTFPKVKMVILHAGYPFFEEAVLLCKYYPNVYLNMTWNHIIDREKSTQITKTFVEMLPTNKIHAFGGDYLFPQQIYGNLLFTKENICRAFSEMIQAGSLTEEGAKRIARDWFYENPKRFYYP